MTSSIGIGRTCKLLAVAVVSIAFCVATSAPALAQTAKDADALNAEVVRLYQAGKYTEATEIAKRVLAIREKALGPNHPDVATALNNLAELYKVQGAYAEAEPLYRRALAIDETALGPDHPNVATSLNNLAGLYDSQGRYTEALPLYKRSLAILETALGPDHPDVATSLNNLAGLYDSQGRYTEALPLYKRSLAIREKVLGPDHPDTAQTLNNLAALYRAQGNYPAAEPLYKRSLAIWETALGPDHPHVATSLNNLAGLYDSQGRYTEAVPLYERSLAIWETALGPDHPDTAQTLNNLAALYKAQGNYPAAEPLYKRSLAILETALGPDHPDVATSLNNLALLYEAQGAYAEAEPLYRRALAIDETALGPDHPNVATSLNNLAGLYDSQGRYTEAVPLYKRSLAIRETALGPDHPDVATSLNNLAGLYDSQGRYTEAEPLYKRSLAIDETALGSNHPHVATSLNNLALLYDAQGAYAEAEPLYKRSLAIWESALGPDHPHVATSLNNLAGLAVDQRDWTRAADNWRRSSGILARRALRGLAAGGPVGSGRSETERNDWQFRGLVKVTYARATETRDTGPALPREMFETAQWVFTSEAAQSLSQMAARGAVGDAALGALVRERQDLVGEWQAKDKLRIAALSQPPEKRNAKAEAETTARLAAIDTRLAEIDARLAKDFPDFAALTSPAPISVADVQALLAPDEALVLFLDTDDHFKPLPPETFIWAVTKDKVQWAKSDIGTDELAKKVAAFRKPLDLWAQSPRGLAKLDASSPACAPDTRALGRKDGECSADSEFSLALAHELYAKLLGPVAETIQDKPRLILVPSGPLTGLPFNALLTESPPAGKATLGTMKQAPWIARRHALTILPSASSLKALRRQAKVSGAKKPFVGFGNPDFRGKQPGGRLDEGESPGSNIKSGETRVATRGVADYFRGSLADVEALRDGLPSLPDTADELRAIGQTLAATDADIVLGPKASEATVKAMSGTGTLAQYKVVAFATHGLIAGQLKGLAEPAIALTVPATASEADDGLLTASEAAALKLDADWVILSACNTAAGGAPDAEALSGLSRAFFYSGTRAMLVSHWEVESSAAVRLTTGTFAALKANPALGRAGAFRASMLDIIDNGAPHEAHPAYWAPFFVVGEGGM